jgi:hypothetical protein
MMRNVLGIADGVIWTDLGDEVVILKFDSNMYFGLDRVGALTWKLIADGRTCQEVLQAIKAQYEISREQAEQDLDELIGELSQEGLIEATA